jgi:type III pantothenate kinase
VNLLLDLGNSRLKWAKANGENLHCEKPLPHCEITSSALKMRWGDFQPQKIAISCVGKKDILALITQVVFELWGDIPIYFAQSEAQAFGVKNGYLQPEKLGVDRFLALIAISQKTHLPVCVVDCGTAITVDILSENGEHQGGLICAGLSLMKNALAVNTADLPQANSPHKIGFANETHAAIFNGTVFAACGLIEKTMSKLPQNTQLFLTGGDAKTIAAQLECAFILDTDLVLQGLNFVTR